MCALINNILLTLKPLNISLLICAVVQFFQILVLTIRKLNCFVYATALANLLLISSQFNTFHQAFKYSARRFLYLM